MGFCLIDGSELSSAETHARMNLAAALAGKYRVIRRLGEGSLGVVFLAEQLTAGRRRVALKVFRRQLLDDPDFTLHFERGMAVAGSIHHPNVVAVFEADQTADDTPYMAMEYLEGQTLRKAANCGEGFPVAEVMEIASQAAQGLDAAHRLGIVHGDVRPENLFLLREGAARILVKVSDFGMVSLRESATQFLAGLRPGLPAYRSPEQTAGTPSDKLDARSDVYALGVLVYELLTGRLPSGMPLRVAMPNLPAVDKIERALKRALEPDREERYPTVLEFAVELAEAAGAPLPPEVQALKQGGMKEVRPPDLDPEAESFSPAAAETESVQDIVKPVATRSPKEPAHSPGILDPQPKPPAARPGLWHRRSDIALELAAIFSGSLLLLFALLHLESWLGVSWITPQVMCGSGVTCVALVWGLGLLGVSIMLALGGIVAKLVAWMKKDPARAGRSWRACRLGLSVAKISLLAVLPFFASARLFLPNADWPGALGASLYPLSVMVSSLLWAAAWWLRARRQHEKAHGQKKTCVYVW